MKTITTIQIKADNGKFTDYTGHIAGKHSGSSLKFSTRFTSRTSAGKALSELQEMTKGNGFEYRLNTQNAVNKAAYF